MKRSKRLGVVLSMSEKTEAQAAGRLEAARNQMIEDQQKLQEIESYIKEYEKEFLDCGTGVRVDEMIRQRSFLNQLAEAKKQQSEILNHRQQLVEAAKEQWHQAYMKRKSLGDLVDRCQKHEQSLVDKMEEKLIDEWNLQSFNRKKQSLQSDQL